MHRQWLLKKLDHYARLNNEERSNIAKIKDFVRSNKFCFNATHPPERGSETDAEAGHITGSAWLISSDKKRVLLTHHRKLKKWLQLGGHSDGHPHVLETALREAREESGIDGISALSEDIFDIDVHVIPAKADRPAHIHYDVRFILITSGSEEFKASEESLELKWIALDEVASHTTEESVLRMCRKWAAMTHHSISSNRRLSFS